MSQWPSAKAQRVLAALFKLGWATRRQTGSHRTLMREGWNDLCSPSTTARKLARGCWRASPSTQGFNLKTYRGPAGKSAVGARPMLLPLRLGTQAQIKTWTHKTPGPCWRKAGLHAPWREVLRPRDGYRETNL